MKKLLVLLIVFSACSKDNGSGGPAPGQAQFNLLAGKFWRASQLTHNGTDDPTVFSRQPTFEFRSDSKLYINEAFPVLHDTLRFDFLNDINIRLTRPGTNPAFVGNLQIDKLDSTEFDFTLTNNQNSDIDIYKSQKQ